jgi:cell wall-associated NlpC family hydrolase
LHSCNLWRLGEPYQNREVMRCKPYGPALLLLFVLVPATFTAQQSAAQQKVQPHGSLKVQTNNSPANAQRASHASPHKRPSQSLLLNKSEGLSVIGAALESRGRSYFKPDCSHLVHSVYARAGFPYSYADSSDLYSGVPEFRHMMHPQPGDLVAWPGHVGIVVNPSQNTFFSSLRSGLGVESYSSSYWMERGTHRFYRYRKSHP